MQFYHWFSQHVTKQKQHIAKQCMVSKKQAERTIEQCATFVPAIFSLIQTHNVKQTKGKKCKLAYLFNREQ